MVQAIGMPLRVVLLPQPVERHGELRAGQRGVAAEAAGQADMVVAALDAGVRVAEIAGDAGADGDRLAGLDQAGGLLDMQLQVGAQAGGIEVAGAGAQRVGVAAAVGDVLGQRALVSMRRTSSAPSGSVPSAPRLPI